jgi:branched-chain amino acid transport system substrate-binding protein
MRRLLKIAKATLLALLLGAGGGKLAAAQDVRIGVVLATTGTFAFVGVPAVNAIRLAHDELTAASAYGAARVSLIVEDNRSLTPEAITLINRMATRDDVALVIGPASTGEAMAAGPVAVNLRIPMFTTAQSPEALRPGPWVFKISAVPDQYTPPFARYIAEHVRPRSCFLVFIRDNDGFIRYKDIFRDSIRAAGVAIAAEESILAADSDFTALATSIANSRADCLFLSTPPEQGANLVLQARQAGMPASTALVGNVAMTSERYMRAGGAMVNNTYMPAEFLPSGVNDAARAFVASYMRRYNARPDPFAAEGYSIMQVVARAIRSIGPNVTRDTLRDALARTREVPVVLGQGVISFDENRVPIFDPVVLVLRDGQWVQP